MMSGKRLSRLNMEYLWHLERRIFMMIWKLAMPAHLEGESAAKLESLGEFALLL